TRPSGTGDGLGPGRWPRTLDRGVRPRPGPTPLGARPPLPHNEVAVSDQPAPRTDADRDRRSVEERRAQLVQAATEVISRDGLGRATTRRITDHADLALGAFHYAFRSKEELLGAV